MKWRIATLTAAMLVGAALPARAGVISTLEATYDGIKFNTFFTFANTSAVTETDVTISTSLAGVLSPSSIDQAVGPSPIRATTPASFSGASIA